MIERVFMWVYEVGCVGTCERSSAEPSRFEVVVGVAVAVIFGIVAFFLVGVYVFAATVWIAPWLGPALLVAGALCGGWLVYRGGRSAKGFGVGMMIGWALLAVWTSGMSLGLYVFD